MRQSLSWLTIGALLLLPCTLAAGKQPLLVFSYDYNDFHHDARGICQLIDVAKHAGFGRIHYRVLGSSGWEFRAKRLPVELALDRVGGPKFDPLRVAVEHAHAQGMQVYAYIDPFENCGPMKDFGVAHPELCLVDRSGRPWWGALCWAYPEVRQYPQTVVEELGAYELDGYYTYWHTEIGRRRAAEVAEICHRHDVRFCPYTYTDALLEYTWRTLGPEGVRQRMFGEVAFLKDTGADCFTNRNLPETLPRIGSPLPPQRIQPCGAYFWSAFREGLRSTGAGGPLWAEPLPGKDWPAVLVVLPRSPADGTLPRGHHADFHPETYRGPAATYRGLLARLGCRMELATTPAELDRSLAEPQHYAAIVFAFRWSLTPWLTRWVNENGPRLLEAVRGGVSLVACHCETTDAALEKLLGVGVVDFKSAGRGNDGFATADLDPATLGRGGELPERIDLSRADAVANYWLPALGTSSIDPAHLPPWSHEVVATATDRSGRRVPVAIAGTVGKGRVFYATATLTQSALLGVDPFCGPNAENVFGLWLAIARWAFPSKSVPAVAMLREHHARQARFAENRLVNGDFEQPPAGGMVPGWIAESRAEPLEPVTLGQNIGLDETVRYQGQCALRLNTSAVGCLTSLAVPVSPLQQATFTAVLRAERAGQRIQVQAAHARNGQAQFDLSDTWRPISLTIQAERQADQAGPVAVWITIAFPASGGTVWVDAARMTDGTCKARKR